MTIATKTGKKRRWRFSAGPARDSVGEPLTDVPRWKREGILSVYLQDKPDRPGRASPLRVRGFQVPAVLE